MSKYKMIVMDMDDTLMNPDNEVSPETERYLIDIQTRISCCFGFRTSYRRDATCCKATQVRSI